MTILNKDSGEQYAQYTKDFAEHWDELVGWEGRIHSEGGFYQRLLHNHGVKTVADVACGTGFHSVTLAREGFEVVATDGSENMVRKTRENAERAGVSLKYIGVTDWLELDKKFGENRFDALICLGNSFTHIFDHEDRRDALLAMYNTIKPGGMIILDHRNYDAILEGKYHQADSKQGAYTGKVDARPADISRYMVRFKYTFPDGSTFELKMYPLRRSYVSFLLEDAGFINVECYGDFEKPFKSDEVGFIQQVAYKPRGD